MDLMRPRLLLAAALVLLLGAAACSSASSDVQASVAGAAATSAAKAATTTTTAPVAVTVHPAVATNHSSVPGSMKTPDGRTRTYHLYVPTSIKPGTTATKVPLLVALHGGLGWGTQFERNSGFDGLAEANGFIVVYPDGVGTGPNLDRNRTWNGGACCGSAAHRKVDDVGFLELLITRLEGQYAIDPRQVFATGHSNGGILALRLACEASEVVDAVGVQSSALEIPTCAPGKPVSLIQIHGTADQNIPINGGTGPHALSGTAFTKPIDASRTLAKADRCPASPVGSKSPTNPDLTYSTWMCPAGIEVRFVQVQGASHAWMGHAGNSGLTGPAYAKLDSSLTIWTFLAHHPRMA